tara:strand:+ start:995 stop:1558 length:564 start_codon:yes stop_codon:yes gene_type:complete
MFLYAQLSKLYMTWDTTDICGSSTISDANLLCTSDTDGGGSWATRNQSSSTGTTFTFSLNGNTGSRDLFVGMSLNPTVSCSIGPGSVNNYGIYLTTGDNKWRYYDNGTKVSEGVGLLDIADDITFEVSGSTMYIKQNGSIEYTFSSSASSTYSFTFTTAQAGSKCLLADAPSPSSSGTLLPPPVAWI